MLITCLFDTGANMCLIHDGFSLFCRFLVKLVVSRFFFPLLKRLYDRREDRILFSLFFLLVGAKRVTYSSLYANCNQW